VNPLNPLYDAVAWVLSRIYGLLSPIFGASSGWTWALTIVLLVVLMRLIMVPLFIKQMHTTRRMTALAPQMSVLRKKYKNDKQTLNQEMMKLYQEAGVNPLMGCLPVAAQLPMFFALFSVLKAIAEWQPGQPTKYGMTHAMVASAQTAKILGVTIADKFLSAGTPLHVRIVILLAVLVSMITTYLTVRQSMKRGMMPAATPDNPMGQSQKYMAYIMPFFALSGLYWPFGLVLYWVTTNLWTLGQQYVLFMRYPQPPPAGGAAAVPATGAVPPKLALRPPAESNGSAGSGKTAGPEPAGRGSAKPLPAVGGDKPGRAPRQPSQGKPAGGARPAAAAPRPDVNGKGANGKGANGKGANGKGANDKGANDKGGGMLRRLGKGRAEPEAAPEAPEVKLVRQQRQRQSRSKRSGKR
jgi:YidC/Oxa1 family membrane protein insertase